MAAHRSSGRPKTSQTRKCTHPSCQIKYGPQGHFIDNLLYTSHLQGLESADAGSEPVDPELFSASVAETPTPTSSRLWLTSSMPHEKPSSNHSSLPGIQIVEEVQQSLTRMHISALSAEHRSDALHRSPIYAEKASRIQQAKSRDVSAFVKDVKEFCNEPLTKSSTSRFHALQKHGSVLQKELMSSGTSNDQNQLSAAIARLKEFNQVWRDMQLPIPYEIEHHFEDKATHLQEEVQIVFFIALVCSILGGLSQALCGIVLALCKLLLSCFADRASAFISRTSVSYSNNQDGAHFDDIAQSIPVTLKSVLQQLPLTSKVEWFAVCPAARCHANYKKPYPSHCSYRLHPDSSECGTTLLHQNADGTFTQEPLKEFGYHSLHDYLGSLLARPDLEAFMDSTCDHLIESLQSTHDFVTDITEATFLRSFEGPRKARPKVLFMDRSTGGYTQSEGRYIFIFNIDFMNIEGLRIRGATTSVGLLTGQCLNLPHNLRTATDNMYFGGVLPGPTIPYGPALNHYSRHLVDELCDSWNSGIYYPRTAGYPEGRLTHSAAAILSFDLMAARHALGRPQPFSHRFCAHCDCYGLPNLGRTDYQNWTALNDEELRKSAIAWRDASTEAARAKIYKETGQQWSEFFRLPYFQPTKQVVVDPMHGIDIGNTSHHFRDLLKLTVADCKQKVAREAAFEHSFSEPPTEDDIAEFHKLPKNHPKYMGKNDAAHIRRILKMLTLPIDAVEEIDNGSESSEDDNMSVDAGADRSRGAMSKYPSGSRSFTIERLNDTLTSTTSTALHWVASDLNLNVDNAKKPNGRTRDKAKLASMLCDWRLTKPIQSDKPPSIKINTMEVLQIIREVIRDTKTPSWLNRAHNVPKLFGDPKEGSLKAAEWRTLVEVYIPIALIAYWGLWSKHQPQEKAHYCQQVLDHTMLLVRISLLTRSQIMTNARADEYRDLMLKYIDGIKLLFPDVDGAIRPNHHVSVHIYDFLRLWGPAKSWFCYPFEHLIGIVQRIPHNHRFGELERTIHTTFLKAARFKSWMSSSSCPPIIKECKRLLDKLYSTPSESVLLTDDDNNVNHDDIGQSFSKSNRPTMKIPEDLQKAITQVNIEGLTGHLLVHAHVRHLDRQISRRDTHLGSSLILYYPDNKRQQEPVPGSVKYIFSVQGDAKGSPNYLLAVQRRRPVEDLSGLDPFQRYRPYFPAYLYSLELEERLEIIEVSWVHGHYACWPVKSTLFSGWDVPESVVVVLSLSVD